MPEQIVQIRSAPGNQLDCTMTVSIRLASTGVTKDTATVILSAQAF